MKVTNEILEKLSNREIEFKDLVSRGYVEWIDADEEEDGDEDEDSDEYEEEE